MDNQIPWWERPCGPLSLHSAGYAIVLFDFIFVGASITLNVLDLQHNKIISILSLASAALQIFLAVLLGIGILKSHLLKCQVYLISSILLLLGDSGIFASYFTSNKKVYMMPRVVYFSIFILYKLYVFWVVRCLIIGIIRNKRIRHTIKRPSFVVKSGTRGSGSTEISTLGRSYTPQRRSSGFIGSYGSIYGIEDILKEIEFPKDNYIPSNLFQIGKETLIVEDEFFVNKGQLEIGEGQFQNIAVKIFKPKTAAEAVRLMLLETKILSMFRKQSNIIQLLGFCTDNIHKGKLILLMEYCDMGTLDVYLKENYNNFQDQIRGDQIVNTNSIHSSDGALYENVMKPDENSSHPFNTRTLILWAFQLANGLQFINSKGIVHGNLSSKFISIHRNKLKITNFTFATLLHHCKKTGGSVNLHQMEGQLPWRYMPCEFMDELSERNFTPMSDVWSLGVVLWEIFSLGGTPYEGLKVNEFFPKLKNGYRLEKPPFATTEIYQILKSCWVKEPTERPNCTQLKGKFTDIMQSLG